jgi:regulator of RNase E activity RraB
MSDEDDDGDDWDFYPCVVDDRPASIFLNLRYEHRRPSSFADTLFWLHIYMLDPAENGLGSAPEGEALFPLEDAFIGTVTKLGLVYVGRLRNDGAWQLAFYGAAEHRDAFSALARDADLGGRRFESGSKPDREWTYYQEFLMPDAERRQWMQDRRLLEVLEEQGDVHSTARRVDHWAYFRTPESRQAFVQDVMRDGFALENTSDDTEAFGAQVVRTDTVELEHIHEVVMKLFNLAEQHGGYYDGWGSPVEKPASN